jgi:hypothetical protein
MVTTITKILLPIRRRVTNNKFHSQRIVEIEWPRHSLGPRKRSPLRNRHASLPGLCHARYFRVKRFWNITYVLNFGHGGVNGRQNNSHVAKKLLTGVNVTP